MNEPNCWRYLEDHPEMVWSVAGAGSRDHGLPPPEVQPQGSPMSKRSTCPKNRDRYNADEVTGTMWASESRIRGMVRDGGFFDYGAEYLDRLFGMGT